MTYQKNKSDYEVKCKISLRLAKQEFDVDWHNKIKQGNMIKYTIYDCNNYIVGWVYETPKTFRTVAV